MMNADCARLYFVKLNEFLLFVVNDTHVLSRPDGDVNL